MPIGQGLMISSDKAIFTHAHMYNVVTLYMCTIVSTENTCMLMQEREEGVYFPTWNITSQIMCIYLHVAILSSFLNKLYCIICNFLLNLWQLHSQCYNHSNAYMCHSCLLYTLHSGAYGILKIINVCKI